MAKILTAWAVILLFLFFTGRAKAQIPTNNPYKSRYNIEGYHWTDSIRWNNVRNVLDFGGNGNGVADNLQAINNGMQALVATGGGVLFFPAGKYFVSDTLRLRSNVVLRGVEPTGGSAKDSTFRLGSKLIFSKYEPTFTGSGTPNSTAFRTIELATGNEFNVGLVNLDINRAAISLHPKFAISTTRPRISVNGGVNNADNWQPITQARNIIVMGVRSNNVAIPDPGVPQPQQHQWQRFCWRFTANIDITGLRNVLVANCRVNDSITDTYKQPGYICRNCPSGTNNQWGPAPEGVKTDFNYADHYGISVNRSKIRINNGQLAIEPFHWYPIPSDEPLLFAKGNEVIDNWVYSTMRVKIIAAGWGLKVKGNVGKDTVNKQFFLTPNGLNRQTNNSATYECRGIDFSGFDVEVVDNDVEVNNGRFPSGFVSICGEGIMNQGNSGGTRINGVKLKNNTVRANAPNNTNPAFTLYRLYNISNVEVDSNRSIGNNQLMLIDADQTGVPQHLYNVSIKNNQVNSLRVRGDGGGKNVIISGNRGIGANLGGQTGSSVFRFPCYADTSNNTGYLTVEPCTGQLPGAVEIPSAVFLNLSGKDTCITSSQTFSVDAVIDGSVDSVVLFSDRGRLARANVQGNTFNYNWNIPSEYGYHYLTAALYKNSSDPFTWVQTFKVLLNTVCSSITSINGQPSQSNNIDIYPNPTKSTLHIRIPHNNQPKSIIICDLQGKPIVNSILEEETLIIPTAHWPKGIFILHIKSMTCNNREVRKIIVE